MSCEFVVGIVDDLRNKSLPKMEVEKVAELENKILPKEVS